MQTVFDHAGDMFLPVIALVAWSHVMWGWMYATRLPAMHRARMRSDPMLPRGEQMALLPARVRWKADNYNNLMEHPTLFYAVAIVIALMPHGRVDVGLAWTYVLLRVLHSLVHALWNKVEVRFGVFFISSLVLVVLTARAAWISSGAAL